MTDFAARVQAALEKVSHADDCGLPADVLLDRGPCDCDRLTRQAARVAWAIERAVTEAHIAHDVSPTLALLIAEQAALAALEFRPVMRYGHAGRWTVSDVE